MTLFGSNLTPVNTVLSLCLLSGTYAMEFAPARHLSFTDFGKHRPENEFKGNCNCRGKVIELQRVPHASFNLANTEWWRWLREVIFPYASLVPVVHLRQLSLATARDRNELKGPILALNMLHCLVTKCKLAGIPASLPEPDLCNQARFLLPVACNSCIIGLSKPPLEVELQIFKQAGNLWW